MPLDPGISLAVQTPPLASPVDQVSKAIALRDMISQDALRRQQIAQSQIQTQDLAAQAQQRNQAIQDQKTLQDALLRHKDDGDQLWTKALGDIQGKVSPQYFNSVKEGYNKTASEGLKLNEEQRKMSADTLGKVDNWLTGISTLDPDSREVEYRNGLARFQADPELGSKVRDFIKSGQIPTQYDKSAVDALHATVVGQKGLLEEEGRRAQTAKEKADSEKAQQDTLKSRQETQNLVAQLPGIEAESKQKQSHLPVARAIDTATLQNPGLLTPEQEEKRKDEEKTLQNQAGNLHVAQGRLALETAKQQAEIGPETAQTWVNTLRRNPDASKEVPTPIRSRVATLFEQQTGLPMPTGATGPSQATELAARNALDNADFIEKAISNPELQKRLGPVLGRLGKFEQNLGTATAGLSPEAAKLAQELRTRMRYFVFQEGKSVLGGRLPQNLMDQLEKSSADVHMDEPTLRGALSGAVGAALTNLDNVDRERFGGKSRPRVLRGLPPAEVRTTPDGRKIASDDGGKTLYNPETGELIQK